jgi:rhodanese-related sulfurtransferase
MENITDLVVNYWWVGLLFIGLVILLSANKLRNAFGGGAIEIKAEQVVELIEQHQAIMIDLAEKRTFGKAHIPGSVNMPGITFFDGSASLEDASKPVILVPMKGLTPIPVLQYLESEGVPKIYIFKGGIKEWKEAGLPILS